MRDEKRLGEEEERLGGKSGEYVNLDFISNIDAAYAEPGAWNDPDMV